MRRLLLAAEPLRLLDLAQANAGRIALVLRLAAFARVAKQFADDIAAGRAQLAHIAPRFGCRRGAHGGGFGAAALGFVGQLAGPLGLAPLALLLFSQGARQGLFLLQGLGTRFGLLLRTRLAGSIDGGR